MDHCKHCGSEVKNTDKFCSSCGKKTKSSSKWKYIFGFLAIILLINLCSDLHENSTVTPEKSLEENSEIVSDAKIQKEEKNYQTLSEIDKMSNKISRRLVIESDNYVEFGFPYQGRQKATLSLRKHPRFGNDVYVSIEKGQIVCSSLEDCIITITFGNEKAERFSTAEPSDYSANILFIQNYKPFVEKIKKNSLVYIEMSFFQEGVRTLEFNISDELQEELKKNW